VGGVPAGQGRYAALLLSRCSVELIVVRGQFKIAEVRTGSVCAVSGSG